MPGCDGCSSVCPKTTREEPQVAVEGLFFCPGTEASAAFLHPAGLPEQ